MKTNLFISIILTLLLSHPLFSATITVCASGCDETSIADAIAAADPNDIIDIQDNVHTEANIEIDKNLTIQGQGQTATIVQANANQGDAVDGVFKILTVGLTVTFQNMTIQNGNALGTMSSTLDTGGAIYIRCNAETNVAFNNVTITNNKSQGDRGGGVYITDDGTGQGTVNFTNCVISNNEAVGSSGDGGGIANRGADHLTMIRCTISGNNAGDDGGGFYVFEEGSTNRFINCTVFNNAAGSSSADEGRAGGFYLSGAANFEFFNCTIVQNSLNTAATRQGAGIYHTSASILDLTNTIVANNSGATSGNDVYTASSSSTFTQMTSLVMDCAEGGGDCPPFSYYGDPNLGSVQTCDVHSYFAATTTSFISDSGTPPAGNIPTDDICGNDRSAMQYDIGSYDDGIISTGLIKSTGDIEAYFANNINYLPPPEQNNYAEPSEENLTDWNIIIDKLLNNNPSGANIDALSLDYEVILFTDDTQNPNKLYYILQKTAEGLNYWGTYVFNPAPCREIIIQAPHPRHDSGTGNQGIYCLKNANAKVFMLAGTHRCNHTMATSCDGLSSVCTETLDEFKISDLAHNSNNCFQLTSNKLHDDLPNSVIVQLHGFAPETDDPDVILSNGTTIHPSGTDYANDFKTHLANTDETLTFKIGHIDNWTRLIGRTNTQGRYINGENTPCTNAATTATGRFVHLEQERTKLRENSTGWEKVSTAMENLIPCTALSTRELILKAKLEDKKVVLTWKTDSNNPNTDFYIERKNGKFETWEMIGFVEKNEQFFTDTKPVEGWNYYRLKQVDFKEDSEYSPTASVFFQKNEAFQIIPNPVRDGVVSIHFLNNNFEIGGELSIFDAMGQLIKVQEVSVINSEFSIENLQSGVYVVALKVDNQLYFKRLVVQ